MQPDNKFYSIDFVGGYKEYDSLATAEQAGGLLTVIERWEKYTNNAYGTSYRNKKYVYEFSQNGSIGLGARFGKIQIIKTDTHRVNGYDKDNVTVTFSDYNGVVIDSNKILGVKIAGIVEAIRFVMEVDSFDSYENYCLSKKNQELVDRIEVLQNRLRELSEGK